MGRERLRPNGPSAKRSEDSLTLPGVVRIVCPAHLPCYWTLLLRQRIIFRLFAFLCGFIPASSFGNAYLRSRRYVSALQLRLRLWSGDGHVLYRLRLTLRRDGRHRRAGDQLRSKSDCATGESHLPYPILKARLLDGNGVLARWSAHRGRSIPDEILVDINVSPDRCRADG